ncbi:Asp23/Gls24 family envelope stress response protein [Tomitella gaofuii]|uniref:Asp23/Gls24 family envelope stress response protein n=1 Tax=Tomitella gaofuii TaxID=2760083 RepID=UPI0015FD54A5|nr:Asp23/Gls24 family envelope stress response protein [Tomitella gaofuii]
MTEVTGELADRIAAAAHAVPGVVGLDGGAFNEVATYLPGRRVPGVRLDDEGRVEVHIIAAYYSDVCAVADAVRDAVTPLAAAPVDVIVEDLEAPTDMP